MMRWECGRAAVDDLITRGRLTRVAPNRELAESYLTQARQHVMSAAKIVAEDSPGAFQLVYDAARKTLAAILVNQGLRPRGQGAHAVLLEVVLAQLEPPRQEVFESSTGCDARGTTRNTQMRISQSPQPTMSATHCQPPPKWSLARKP